MADQSYGALSDTEVEVKGRLHKLWDWSRGRQTSKVTMETMHNTPLSVSKVTMETLITSIRYLHHVYNLLSFQLYLYVCLMWSGLFYVLSSRER